MPQVPAMTKQAFAAQYVTVSKVVPMVSCTMDQFKDMQLTFSIGSDLKDNILQETEKRFGQREYSLLLAMTTMLDSRFKNSHFKKPDACAKASFERRQMIAETKQAAVVSSTLSEEEASLAHNLLTIVSVVFIKIMR